MMAGMRSSRLAVMALAEVFLALVSASAEPKKTILVGPAGGSPAADYSTIQEAVAAAPETGALIRIRPGTYREVVHIDRPGIELRGESKDPSAVVLVFANGASNTCGTGCSATLFVTGDDFRAETLTIANDWSKTGKPRTQAVALSITADRAVLRHVRLLGAQDTLYANSKSCKADGPAPCHISRQYFRDCYIEGEVDFIFGNSKAVFDRCEIHSIPHDGGGYLTAQSRLTPEQNSGYVFDRCKATAEPGVSNIFLGRPWRAYATVTFLNSKLGPHIAPAGWSEWHKGDGSLKTPAYAEFHSTGPGANPSAREPNSKQLSKMEAAKYEPKVYLAGSDGWDPTRP